MSTDHTGKGMVYPIVINQSGSVDIVSGLDLIRSSILNILTFSLGVRFFNNEFGSRLNDLLEEPNEEVLSELVSLFVTESIEEWEKRVNLLEVSVNRQGDTKLAVSIQYQMKNSLAKDTLVYPFYLNS